MLKIRLQRVGKKHEPVFRVVVTDSHSGPKAGKSVEILGSYDPRFNKSEVKAERVKYWMENGAQVSPTVHNLLVNSKIVEGKKVNVLPKKTALVKEAPETPEAPVVAEMAEETKAESQTESSEEEKVEEPATEVPAPTSPEGEAESQSEEVETEEPAISEEVSAPEEASVSEETGSPEEAK